MPKEEKIEFVCRVREIKHTESQATVVSLRPQVPSGREACGLVPSTGWEQVTIFVPITGIHYVTPGKYVRVTIEEVDPETLPAYDPA